MTIGIIIAAAFVAVYVFGALLIRNQRSQAGHKSWWLSAWLGGAGIGLLIVLMIVFGVVYSVPQQQRDTERMNKCKLSVIEKIAGMKTMSPNDIVALQNKTCS